MSRATETPTAEAPVELVPAVVGRDELGTVDGRVVNVVTPVAAAAVVTPTQLRRPWRSAVRTWFQAAVGAATLIPLVVGEVYTDAGDAPAAVAQAVVVCGAVSRVMAMPAVEVFLRRFAPFLAAAPAPPADPESY